MKTLVIDRKFWQRGNVGTGRLLSNGTMCCLGFECRLRKFTKKDINNLRMPDDLSSAGKNINGKRLGWLVRKLGNILVSSSDSNKLASINDDSRTTDEFKEAEIIRIFALHGRPVVFIN